MTSTVQHKRGATSGTVPSSLLAGEHGVQMADGRLFYGNGSVVKEYPFSLSAFVAPRVLVRNTGGLAVSALGAVTNVTAWSLGQDRNSNFNLSSGIFTAPVLGTYRFSFLLTLATSLALGSSFKALLYQNSTTLVATFQQYTGLAVAGVQVQGSIDLPMAAGDTLMLKTSQSGTLAGNLSTDGTQCFLSITMAL